MNEKTKILADEKIKSKFYKNKNLFNIYDRGVDQILISKHLMVEKAH